MTTPPSLGSIIAEALIAYSGAPSLEQFLDDQVGAERAGDILDFLHRTDLREAEVQAARRGGQSTARWLGNQLAEVGDMPASTGELLASLAPGVTGQSAEKTGQRILTAAQVAMGMGAEALGASDQEGAGLLDQITAPEASGLVDAFLQAPVGDPKDRAIIAAASAGVIRGAEKLGLKPDPFQLTGMVDLGFRAAKVAHKVGAGELSGADAAVELITDRFAAQVGAFAGSFAGRAVEKGLPMLGAAVGTFIESAIPLGGKAVQVCQEVGRIAGKVARPFVEQGVRKLTRTLAKNGRRLLKRVAQQAVPVLKKLKAAVLSLF